MECGLILTLFLFLRLFPWPLRSSSSASISLSLCWASSSCRFSARLGNTASLAAETP